MNTIERIEARRSQPSCHDQTEWHRVTADEWVAIKTVIEAAFARKRATNYVERLAATEAILNSLSKLEN